MKAKLILILAAIIVLIGAVWFFWKGNVVAPVLEKEGTDQSAVSNSETSLGATLYGEISSNSPAEEIPQTNPFESKETNPVKGVYENPFE